VTALTLIRHGETDWNLAGRIQGSTDIPLNDTGRIQAREAGAALRDRLDLSHGATVVSSELSRARETAALIADELGLPEPRAYRGLQERSYGEAEGLEVTEFRSRWGDRTGADVPGAESLPDLRARALAALGRVVRDHRRETAPSHTPLIVVSHGALIRELLSYATAGHLPAPGTRLPNGAAYDFVYERDHLRLLAEAGLPV
jgi:broad specificity phosphatase PhoE